MNDCVIYHNPRCSKSRQTLQLLRDHGIEPRIIEYLKTPPTLAELRRLRRQLDLPARAMLRTGEDEYRQLGLANEQRSDDDLLAAIVEHPILLERPIVVRGQRAVIGRPPDNVHQLL